MQRMPTLATCLLLVVGCGGASVTNPDPVPTTTVTVAPQFRVVEVGADSTLVSVSNPSNRYQTQEFAICPLDAQIRDGGEWRHNGFLVRGEEGEGGGFCAASAAVLLPGGEHQFWVPRPLPFDGHLLRLGIQAGDLSLPPGTGTWIYTDAVAPPE